MSVPQTPEALAEKWDDRVTPEIAEALSVATLAVIVQAVADVDEDRVADAVQDVPGITQAEAREAVLDLIRAPYFADELKELIG